ncbi:15-hydroxyprostaglandin dehydrogenase [NAD(+)]-like [Aethina tumida]|uniref:15-hydroxyprostaglandin dehydrogenase [NAD(+)]-like n=1 Tax=Aethina tumida TaxID=116153 RepID=UPI0021492F9D|nr:15-hydroxyprostaglandin dehydrogenase [NAD(+)]-like [Aethina tumida]
MFPNLRITLPNLVKSLTTQKRSYSCENSFAKCKVGLVTGGAGNLGTHFAHLLLKSGAKAVVIADIADIKQKPQICDLMKTYGSDKVEYKVVDITNKDTLRKAYKSIIYYHGQLDFVINCARHMSIDNWERDICVNNYGMLLSTFMGMEYMGNQACKGIGGTIVNVGSMAGVQPFYPVPVYTGSQHFLVQFVRSIGHDFYFYKSNVRIMGFLTGGICRAGKTSPLSEPMKKDSPWKCIADLQGLVDQELKKVKMYDPKIYEDALDVVMTDGRNGDIWVAEGIELYKVLPYTREKLRAQ